jgi:hypothetical protein
MCVLNSKQVVGVCWLWENHLTLHPWGQTLLSSWPTHTWLCFDYIYWLHCCKGRNVLEVDLLNWFELMVKWVGGSREKWFVSIRKAGVWHNLDRLLYYFRFMVRKVMTIFTCKHVFDLILSNIRPLTHSSHLWLICGWSLVLLYKG